MFGIIHRRHSAKAGGAVRLLFRKSSCGTPRVRRIVTVAIVASLAGIQGCSYRSAQAPAGDVETVLRRGVTRADGGDYRAAISDYDGVLLRQPQNATAIYLRGTARDRLGDRAGALADYDAALRLDANLLPAHVARAAVHTALGNRAAAAADYEAARRLMGDDQVH
jgi:tetratricopeptide (TPR) repeat protein